MTDPEEEHIWLLTEHSRWSEAEVAARARLVSHPDSAWTFQALAYALRNQSRLIEAAEAAEESCRLGPSDPWNFIVLSDIFVSRREGREAVASAQRAVELAPSMWNAHYQLANAYLTHTHGTRHFQPEAALAPAREAMRLAPHSVEGRSALAHALRALGRRRESRVAYRAMLSLDPNSARALDGLGVSYAACRPATAARYLTAALRQQPGFGASRQNLSWVFHSWIRRMTLIWLTVGTALALLRWFVESWIPPIPVILLTAFCSLETLALMRHVPTDGRWEMLWRSRYPTVSRLVTLLGVAVVVCTIAVGTDLIAVLGMFLLGVLGVAQWKVNFLAVERRARARLRRT